MKRRIYKLLAWLLLVLVLGLCYAWFVYETGKAIPCLFHMLTGFYCPGCGITRMSLCLLRGDILGALESNWMLMLISPYLIFYGVRFALHYIKNKTTVVGRIEHIIQILLLCIVILYGIFRNF